MIFTANSIICALVALIYLIVLQKCTLSQQRHILNQGLFSLYLFSVGIYLLVNLPAADYMHGNPSYQIVFEAIPKKFFASTLAFGLSFYLPHLLCFHNKAEYKISFKKSLSLSLFAGAAFFNLDFLLLFFDPPVFNFQQIYFDSILINTSSLLLVAGAYIFFNSLTFAIKPKTDVNAPVYLTSLLYHYLVSFSVIIVLICLACEYRLISFSNGCTLAASGLLLPFAILASNFVGEVYGYKANLYLAIVLIVAGFVFDIFLMSSVALPAPKFFNLNPFYSFIMPRRVPATTIAVFVAFITNALLLEKLKYTGLSMNHGSRLLIANVFSASLLSLVNYTLVYAGVYPQEQIFNLVLGGWIYKLGLTLLGLPLVIWLYGLNQKNNKVYSATNFNKIRFPLSRE